MDDRRSRPDNDTVPGEGGHLHQSHSKNRPEEGFRFSLRLRSVPPPLFRGLFAFPEQGNLELTSRVFVLVFRRPEKSSPRECSRGQAENEVPRHTL